MWRIIPAEVYGVPSSFQSSITSFELEQLKTWSERMAYMLTLTSHHDPI